MGLSNENNRDGQIVDRKDAQDATAVERPSAVDRCLRIQQDTGDEKARQGKKKVNAPGAELHHGQEPAGDRPMTFKNIRRMPQQDGDDCESSQAVKYWDVAT